MTAETHRPPHPRRSTSPARSRRASARGPMRSTPRGGSPTTSSMEIASAGLFKMAVPEAGAAWAPTCSPRCASSRRWRGPTARPGWCLAMGVNTFRHSAQFAPDVRRELFHSDPVGVSAGSANPRGRAVAVPGRLPGHRPLVLRQRLHARVLAARGLPRLRRRRPAPASQRRPGGAHRLLLPQGGGGDRRHLGRQRDAGHRQPRRRGGRPVRARGAHLLGRRAPGARHGADEPHPRLRPRRLRLRLRRAGRGPGGDRRPGRARPAKTPRSRPTCCASAPSSRRRWARRRRLLRSGRASCSTSSARCGRPCSPREPITERQRAELRLAMTHAAQSAARATHLMSVTAGTTSIFTAQPARALRPRRRGGHPPHPAAVPELRGGGPHPPGTGIEQPPVLAQGRP